jgi:hypothetical protein
MLLEGNRETLGAKLAQAGWRLTNRRQCAAAVLRPWGKVAGVDRGTFSGHAFLVEPL